MPDRIQTKTLPPAHWRTCVACLTRMAPGTTYVHDPRRQYGELARDYCIACAPWRAVGEQR